MRRFTLICLMVVATAAAVWAASATDKVVPLKTLTSSTSFQALLNDLQQQAAAKSSQGGPRVSWRSLLNAAQMNKTNSSAPHATMDVGNVRGGGSAPRLLSQPNQTPRLKGDVSNVRSGGSMPHMLSQPNQPPRLTGDLRSSSSGNTAPRVMTLQDQIFDLEGQIDRALVRHEDTADLYAQLNSLYAQREPEKDMPSVPKNGGSVDNVPVACGGDTCASATNIPSLPYCVACSTVNAHDDYHPTCTEGPSGPDVVFKYTPTTNQVVSFSLCGSAFNTVLSVYDGCPVAGVAPVCCSDNGCGPNNLQSCCPGVALVAGHTYYIIVDGANPAAFGQFLLHVTLGNVCASAPCFTTDTCPYPNREVDANDGCGEPDLPTLACTDTVCGEIRPNGDRDWYRIVIPENSCKVLKVDVFGNDTPGFFPFGRGLDPLVALYASDCTTLIGGDDNGGEGYDSRLITDCLPAGVYFIRVVGVQGSTGPYVLAITCRNCDCPLRPCVECPANGIQEDEGCTPNSASINGGCNDVPPQFGTIDCGEFLCGTLWERAIEGGYTRDTDWYRFVLEGRDSVRFTVKANIPYVAYILQTVGALAPCDSLAFFAAGNGDTCEVITLAACLPAGTYYFALAAQFGHVFSCARYLAHMECLPCSELPSCVRCPENGVPEDEACVAFSPSANGGCNDLPPQYGQINCGELLCGTFWEGHTAAGAEYRDTDWYQFALEHRDSVRFTVKADKPFVTYIVQLTGATNPCDTILTPFGAVGDSCEVVTVAACLPPGVYYFFVAPQFSLPDFDCGKYIAHMECLPCSEVPSCVFCPENGVQEDEGCTANSPSADGGCNDAPPQFGQIQCGELLCGTFWETNDGSFRDTDWYRFVLEERDSVRFVVRADKAFQTEILQVTDPNSPCNLVLATDVTYDDSCNTVTLAACLAPGVYYLFVAPQFALPNFDCGHYLARMECLPCTERPSCIVCPENVRHEQEPCPNFPDNINGGCDAREPHFLPIECNDQVCGTVFAGFDPAGNRVIDEDWYQLRLGEGDSLRFCMRADFRAVFAIFWAGFNPPCDTTSEQLVAFGQVDSCGEGSCIAACLPAGLYYLALAPVQATNCGHYVISTQCLPCAHGCIVCPENVPHEEEACLSYPDVTNGGCFTRGEVRNYSRIECNSAICGTSWFLPARNDSSTSLYDTDWYLFNLTAQDSARFVLRSDFPAILGIGYFRSGVVSCDSLTILGGVEVAACQSYTVGACLPPGRYVVIILPDVAVTSLPPILCGHYVLGVFCEPCSQPCVICPPNAAIEEESCSPPQSLNNGCDSPPGTAPLFGHINCGQTICGTSWEFQSPNGGLLRDTDWFQFPVAQGRDSIVFTYRADFTTAAAIYRLPSAAAPCPGELVWNGVIDSCETTLFGLCLTPGLYSVVITPALGHFFECGHYVINEQCLECSPCPEAWAVDGYDMGDIGPCYPTLPMNPAHGISNIAWLGQSITAETTPTIGGDDLPLGGDDGVQYLHLPWTPCAMETVIVTVTGGQNYARYEACGGHLYLNGWKDGNLNGSFCDTMWCGGAAARILADEWIVKDSLVQPGVYVLPVLDPGMQATRPYDGVFRWRLTSHPIGRYGFGQATTQCAIPQCGNFAVDFLGEVEDYDLHDAQLDVSLTSFEAIPGDNQVTLRWVTASETGNDYFRVMRDNSEIAHVNSQGNGASRHVYTYTDDRAANGARYSYTLIAMDQTGGGTVLESITAAPSPGAATVTEYALHQNYPNPFNPTTNITFDLVDGGYVNLKVYNLVGQEVATIVNGTLAKGEHIVSFDASKLPTGIYVYRLEVNGFTAARKMLLTK